MSGNMTFSWREAVAELLSAAEISQAELAGKIGIARTNVTRWLAGTVIPTAPSIRAVNKAMAALIASPDVEAYLSTLAIVDDIDHVGLRDVDVANPRASKVGRLIVAAGRLLRGFSSFFDGDVHKTIGNAFRTTPSKGLALCTALAFVRGRQIVAGLQGVATRRPYFDSVAMLFREAGLDSVLKHDATTDILRAREATRFEIDLILQKFSLPTSERLPLAQKLHHLTDGIFSAVLSASVGLRESDLSALAKEFSGRAK